MNNARKLDKASGIFFFSGFMLSKLQYVPFPIAAGFFRFFSLGLYFGGYVLWFAASLLQPEHKKDYNQWYGFAKIKEQFAVSSLVGLTATVLSIVAVFIPIIFPPAAWLFLIGNIIWTIGEYHKLKNPPLEDLTYSHTQQKAYLSYALTTTVISLITAIAATLIVVFPLASVPITVFSLLLCVGLGALAFEYWLNSNFGDHKPGTTAQSYFEMADMLDNEPRPEPAPECAPYHGNGLFNSANLPQKTKASSLNTSWENVDMEPGSEELSLVF